MTDPAALLERLIRVPTHNPGGDERALAEVLVGELRAREPDEVALVEVERPGGAGRGAYVFARFGRPRLLVNAHLDTVPPNAGWSGDPFQPRISGGRVFGLGAADTKGAIAAILSALDEARPRDLAILFSGDEERGSSCMCAFLDGPHARGLTHAIVCEPTRCRVGIRHRGVLALEARVRGEGGHSSRADLLPAPIADLARLAVAWDDWGRRHRGIGPPNFSGMCLNVARLEGGVAFNVVPEEAMLSACLRPPPGSDARGIREELIGIAALAVPAATISVALDHPPFATRDPSAFRPWLGGAVGAPVDLGFWTEAALLSNAGIDAVVYGPGDIAQAHAPDEWVSAEDLLTARRAFVEAFRAASGEREEGDGSG